jgi:two-component system chemotaxis response regulator CheY
MERTILIVDSASTIRQLITKGIQENLPDIKIDESNKGIDAIQKLDVTKYSLVICEKELLDMDGEEVLIWLRTHPIIYNTPFIMLSSSGDKESVTNAIKLGVNYYLVKPLKIEDLIQKIINIGEHPDRRKFKRFSVKGSCQLNINNHTISGDIINLSLGGVSFSSSSSDLLPEIFQKGQISIKTSHHEIDNIEAYIIKIESSQFEPENPIITLTAKFKASENGYDQRLFDYLAEQHRCS